MAIMHMSLCSPMKIDPYYQRQNCGLYGLYFLVI